MVLRRQRYYGAKVDIPQFKTIRSIFILLLFSLYMIFLFVSESFLEGLQQKRQDLEPPKRGYIIFEEIAMGQGTGNVISGLLAAHLLGLEFDRLVCVREQYAMFHQAFESIDPRVSKFCPDILKQEKDIKKDCKHCYMQLVTYMKPPDECVLQQLLASDKEKIVILQANTYPRWPHIPSKDFFFQFYRAKRDLIEYLPYKTPPSTVVHLRVPDGQQDERKGLDDKTLQALGKELPSDTYLVTNQPSLYDFFEQNFHWKHPQWKEIYHSGFAATWKRNDHYMKHVAVRTKDPMFRSKDQNLQMWADWYTLLTARQVYHTHSDFSVSAIHWNTIPGHVIQGTDPQGRLLTTEESWLVDGETPALINRRRGVKGKGQLRKCQGSSP